MATHLCVQPDCTDEAIEDGPFCGEHSWETYHADLDDQLAMARRAYLLWVGAAVEAAPPMSEERRSRLDRILAEVRMTDDDETTTSD